MLALAAPVFLVAFSLLALELSLFRILALAYWHHQAQLILAGALLGMGASGTALAMARERWLRRSGALLSLLPLLYLASLVFAYRIALAVPFNVLELAWNPRELVNLMALHLALSLPFLVGGFYLGLALVAHRGREHALYAANLLGSGGGALAAMVAPAFLPPDWLVATAALSGAAAAAGGIVRSAAAGVLALLLFWPRAGLEVSPSPYKSERQALLVPGTQVVAERWGPLGLWRALAGPSVHYAPGLSLEATGSLPPQVTLFVDGEEAGAVTTLGEEAGTSATPERGRGEFPSFLSRLPTALPYRLRPASRVFVAGLGGGLGVLEALAGGADTVEVAEIDRRAVALLDRDLAAFSGHLLERPETRLRSSDARLALRHDAGRFDLIRLAYLEGMGPAGAGLFAARENNLLTVESLQLCLARLSPEGILVIANWITLPPRDALRALTTLSAALAPTDPAPRLLMIRSWNTTLLVASPTPFRPEEVARAAAFCEENRFDVVFYAGMSPAEGQRYHLMEEPSLQRSAAMLLGPEKERFFASYPFALSPATDDRPYFSHFFRWRTLPTLWRQMGRDLIPYLEGGYLLLVGGLVEGLFLSAVLLLLPLMVLALGRRGPRESGPAGPDSSGPPSAARVLLYFAGLGLGFMLLELAVLGKINLAVGHPAIAAGITVAGFLLFSGVGCLGGAWSERRPVDLVPWAAVLVAVEAIAFPYLVEPLVEAGAGLSVTARAALCFAVMMPLALPLGLFFPAGLARLASSRPELVPWAWAVNGFASVAGTLLGALLPLSLGFRATLGIAGACYLAAGLARIRRTVIG